MLRRCPNKDGRGNRFYQRDFNVEALEVVPQLPLSTSKHLRLPLHWIAILYGRVPVDLAVTSDVHDVKHVIKAIVAGAHVAMLTSELFIDGIGRLTQVRHDLEK